MAQVNFDLLERWSPERAWWWGVLLGDGNVYEGDGNAKVTVVGSLSTTTRWKDLIAPAVIPHEFKHSSGTYQACVNSRVLVEWFKAKGLCGPKTFNLPWPEDLPREHLAHFLRGLWDTDGSLFFNKNRGLQGITQFGVKYISACKPFVERVREALEGLAGVPRHAITESVKRKGEKRYSTFDVPYTGNAAVAVAEALYLGAPEHLRNEDRMAVFRRMQELKEKLSQPCPCGRPATHQGKCQACFWKARGRTTGPGTECTRCHKHPIAGRGLCSTCISQDRRANSKNEEVV